MTSWTRGIGLALFRLLGSQGVNGMVSISTILSKVLINPIVARLPTLGSTPISDRRSGAYHVTGAV